MPGGARPSLQSFDISPLSLLEQGLEALNIGLGIFDGDLELVECNRLFRDLRCYPANLCEPGVGLRELLRHDLANGQLTAAGAGDPVETWLDHAARRRTRSEEIEQADGRIVAMTIAPLADRGVLLTFADITERSRAERDLRATKEWYDLVTEASSEGIYDLDVATDDLKVSYRLTAMLGLTPGTLTRADWNDRIHPEDAPAYRDAVVAHFKGETPYLKSEYRVRRNTGDYIWFADSGKCVRDDRGWAIRLVGAVSDITARKLAEASLQNSEERYALAMEAINEGVYDWDIERDRIFYSEGVRASLGLDPRLMKTANDWFERIHPDDVPRWQAALIDHFKGRTDRFECEIRYRAADDRWRWARQHGIARFDEDGKAVRMIGATGDITELREHQEAADEAREQLATAIEAISEGFAIYDADDRLILCNDEYRAIYPGIDDVMVPGVTFETVLRTCADRGIFADLGDDVEAGIADRLRKHRDPGPPFDSRLSDGRWARVAWKRTRSGGVVGVFTDITEIKEAELHLQESEERYALATEAATEGLYDWNTAEDNLHVSDRLNAIMSLPSGHLSSIEWNKRIHPSDQDKYRAAIVAHFRGETPHLSCEYRIRDGEGNYLWVADNATSVRDETGRAVRLVGAITDISARKQANQELREAKRRAEDAGQLAVEKAQALELLSSKLSKYLSPQVYSEIFAGTREVELDAKRKKLTVFFSDIAGFTTIVDSLESEALTVLLNEYLTEMSRIALAHGATIDKFIGDAILAFFGDPESKGPKEDAVACVKMAIAMQRRLRELQTGWRDLGLEQVFELRIGITTGFCTVGNFGSEDRMDYTVVGNEVNLAARLQAQAEAGGILMSSETHGLVKGEIHAEDQGYLELRGFARPLHAFKVIGIYDELIDAGELIKIEQPGLSLLVDPAEFDADQRAKAIEALETVRSRLSDTTE